MEFIDLKSQQIAIKKNLDSRISNVLEHGQYIMGPEIEELEKSLESFAGTNFCITVSSGTDALLISLMALKIGIGDEVITTPFTWVSSAEVIALLGAEPVFVDVEEDTCNICVEHIEKAISPKTKAIMPVSLFGQPSDMDEINLLAKENNLVVIEDGAQSFGAVYKGKKSCNLSTIGCTSFFPSKPLGCYGDGGAIFTEDENLARACKEIRLHGQERKNVYTKIGIGGRMDTLQAAIVLAKLENFDWEIEQRGALGNRYNIELDKVNIERVQQRSDRTSVFAQYTIFVDERDKVVNYLSEKGIPTAIHYPQGLNHSPAYSKFCSYDLESSDNLAKKVLSLPMHPYLKEEQQDFIVRSLSEAQ